MILVVDISDPSVSLLFDEFVLPVIRIIQQIQVELLDVHISKINKIPDDVSAIILCGTCIADLWYTKIPSHIDIIGFKGPVLGICAGMQILLRDDGGEIVPALEIGMINIRLTDKGKSDPITTGKDIISGYSLHQKMVHIPESWDILGVSDDLIKIPHIVRSNCNKKYGVLFHPEVRNEWIIERFVQKCLKNLENL